MRENDIAVGGRGELMKCRNYDKMTVGGEECRAYKARGGVICGPCKLVKLETENDKPETNSEEEIMVENKKCPKCDRELHPKGYKNHVRSCDGTAKEDKPKRAYKKRNLSDRAEQMHARFEKRNSLKEQPDEILSAGNPAGLFVVQNIGINPNASAGELLDIADMALAAVREKLAARE
jgi:hypothetical protein